MTREVEADVEEYMALPYRMEVTFDEDHWAAEFPELPGLVAGHETWEGLLGAVDEAKRAYFSTALELDMPIPPPGAATALFSGRIMLRLSRSLHASASRRAQLEGVSLNTLVAAAVAKEVGWAQAGTSPAAFAHRNRRVPGRRKAL